jgi:parvulin-like peptidyl-prolyl isomerase
MYLPNFIMKLYYPLLFLFALGVFGCGASHNSDNNTILRIGQYKLTPSDLEWQRKGDRYKSLSNEALQEKLVENGRILAYALDHRYDTVKALNKLLSYASRAYATSNDGFVWNKKVKPKLELTESDLKNAYQKRAQQLVLEVIQFQDKALSDKYYASAKDFDALKEKVSFGKKGQVFIAPSRFPNVPLSVYVTNVENAKAGDVLGPVETEDGYLVVRVAAIEPANQNAFEREKEGIKQELLAALTRKYMWANQKQVNDKADIKINDDAVLKISSALNAHEKNWPGISPDLILMNYELNGKPVTYRLSDFEEFVKNEPVFFGSVNNPTDVKKMLRYFITEQYLFAEAQQMNVQANEDYQQFRRNYQQKIFIEHFKRSLIYPKLSVQPQELENYYRNHAGNYSVFGSATVTMYKFKTFQEAFHSRMALSRKVQGNTNQPVSNASLKAATLPEATVTEIKMDDPGNSPQLVDALLKLAPGQISSPINVNGEFLMISVSAKNGMTKLPFAYAKEQIKKIVQKQKEEQLTAQTAKGFEAKYPIEKNTIQEYLSQAEKQ